MVDDNERARTALVALVTGMMLSASFRDLFAATRRDETHDSQSLVHFFLGAVVMVLSLQILTMLALLT